VGAGRQDQAGEEPGAQRRRHPDQRDSEYAQSPSTIVASSRIAFIQLMQASPCVELIERRKLNLSGISGLHAVALNARTEPPKNH
jgi:hypothetical protein